MGLRLSKKSVFALAQERQSLPLMREVANWSASDNLTEGEKRPLRSLPQPKIKDFCQPTAVGPVAALTAQRAVIHYRNCASLTLVRGGQGRPHRQNSFIDTLSPIRTGWDCFFIHG